CVPSQWVCDVLSSYGLPSKCQEWACHVSFTSTVAVSIATGDEDDLFIGRNTLVPVSVSLAGGADTVIWEDSSVSSPLSIDLGLGWNNLTLICPILSSVNASLGDDDQAISTVNVWDG